MDFGWIVDIFRSFISLADRMVYWFIELLVILFDSLAEIQIFSGETIKPFTERIYLFISIIMIFKVSFSIIQYIINPDSFSERERGVGKMVQGILLVLVSLVFIPYIFNFAYDLQHRVIKGNLIPKLILGMEAKVHKMDANGNYLYNPDGSPQLEPVGTDEESQKKIKKKLPFAVLSSFIQFNSNEISQIKYENGDFVCGKPRLEDSTEGSVVSVAFANCITGLSKEGKRPYYIDGKQIDCADNGICSTGGMYKYAYDNSNYSLLLDLINDKSKDDKYIFDYKFIISTVAGVFVAIMYLNFCIDLAIRAVKFGFLQLIAPIPVISMVDPKSTKSGMMSKWVKTSLSTYAGLFIRVAAVNFVLYIIMIITAPGFLTSINTQANEFVTLVIILGALLFAKQLPKLITDLTGLNLSGDFKMNPFQRIPGVKQATKVVTKVGGAAVGGAVGYVGGAVAGGLSNAFLGKNPGKILLGVGKGAVSGAFNGMRGGYGAKGLGAIQKGVSAAQAVGETNYKNDGTTLASRTGARIQHGLGLKTTADRQDRISKIMDDINSSTSELDKFLEGEVLKNKNGAYNDVADAKNALDMIGSVDRQSFYNSRTGSFDQAAYDDAVRAQAELKTARQEEYFKALKAAKNDYYSRNRNDERISSRINIIERNNTELRSYGTTYEFDPTSYEKIDDYNKSVYKGNMELKSSQAYDTAHKVENAIKRN